ncbi:MAG: flavocytochrome c [Spirochaetaceae bacterium]|jgi:fumarate reductase flavoprotein subunit|nr:flavocytochrome c [Spirochaetaceae bacterium]
MKLFIKKLAGRTAAAGLLLVLLAGFAAGCASAPKFSPGVYEGTAKGFGGDVIARVELSDSAIVSVTVSGDNESQGIGSIAIAELPGIIVQRQTTQVDAIAGASVSSRAVIEAVNAALRSAGVDPAKLTGKAVSGGARTSETVNADVVVVGGGGAGMAAAIIAKQAGLNVVLIEKMAMLGGNSSKSTGGMNAAETKYQKEQNISDSVQTFIDDTMKGGGNIADRSLVTILARSSAEAIDWLDSIGAPLPRVSFSGGATNRRIHQPADGSAVGIYLVAAFEKKLKELNIPVYLNTKATDFIVDSQGRVTGVKAESSSKNYTFNGKATVLATGGFGANEAMYTRYRPELKGFVTTNSPGATGDGIVMAEKIHAALVDIEQIQIHPTVEQNTAIMVTEAVRGDGAILVNKDGRRFTNEMGTRDVVSAAVIAQSEGFAYIVFDQELRAGLKAIEGYVTNNIVTEGATIQDLAGKLGMSPAVLAETLSTWNAAVRTKRDSAFSRNTGMEKDLSHQPYYAIKIAPGVHHTMGGVKINTQAQVISTAGNPIPGLFAAGEVTGGIHGNNRIGGNAVADIVIFGRIAGASAARAAKGN